MRTECGKWGAQKQSPRAGQTSALIATPRRARTSTSRDVTQLDDRHVAPTGNAFELEDELSPHASLRFHSRAWIATSGSERIARTRLPSASSGSPPLRRSAGVRPASPWCGRCRLYQKDVEIDLAREAGEGHRHDRHAAEHLALERSEESLDDGNAAAPSDGAEAGADPAARARGAVVVAKLGALIGDDVLRSCAALASRGIEQSDGVSCRGLQEKKTCRDDSPQVVVEDRREPEAEGPALDECLRDPGHQTPLTIGSNVRSTFQTWCG
jgi:hypothetical protein